MRRNIEILFEIKSKIHQFNFLTDEISQFLDIEDTEISDMIEESQEEIYDLLVVIKDIDLMLDSLTEDIKEMMRSQGFDSDDFKVWNEKIRHNKYSLEGLLETFENSLQILELFVLETVRGYKILNQYIRGEDLFPTEKKKRTEVV